MGYPQAFFRLSQLQGRVGVPTLGWESFLIIPSWPGTGAEVLDAALPGLEL